MDHFTHFLLRTGLASCGILCYVVALVYIKCCRHQLPRSSTLNLVTAFSIIRIIACTAQITATATNWDTADRISIVAGYFGVSLLLLAKSDMLSRVYSSILRLPLNHPFVFFTVTIIPLNLIIILSICIIDVVLASTSIDIAKQAAINNWTILYLYAFSLLVILTMGTGIQRYITHYRDESTLLHALIASLPLLLLRLTYPFLIISNAFSGWMLKATVIFIFAEPFMRLVEMQIVLLFLHYNDLPRPETRHLEEKPAMVAVEDQHGRRPQAL
ncbi:hypothetical protein GGI35DRAFT_198776 [Trichoderma velutinum]